MRSYLVGEVHADWLDEDDGDDLITTDRQDILWESEYGRALRRVGCGMDQEDRCRIPVRLDARGLNRLFLEASELEDKARRSASPTMKSFPRLWSWESRSAASPPKTNSVTKSMWMV